MESALGNIIARKSVIKASSRVGTTADGVIRASEGTLRAGENF